MGPAFSIFGLVFLIGALVFVLAIVQLVVVISRRNRSHKVGPGIWLLMVFAIFLMATPVGLLLWMENASPQLAFRMFFDEKPAPEIEFLNNQSGSGTDYSSVRLAFRVPDEPEFERLAVAAGLTYVPDAQPPSPSADSPTWWAADDCPAAPLVYERAADDQWDEKWAVYCTADRRVHAFAVWIE